MMRYNVGAVQKKPAEQELQMDSSGRIAMRDFNLLIDGKMVPGDLEMPVLNPATEEVLAQCPRASKAQLDTAVAAAKAAFPAWAATPIEERRKLVTKMAEPSEATTKDLAARSTANTGKRLA